MYLQLTVLQPKLANPLNDSKTHMEIHLTKMQEEFENLMLRRRQLEEQLIKIAQTKSSIYQYLDMSKRYGKNNGGPELHKQIESIDEFEPKNRDS